MKRLLRGAVQALRRQGALVALGAAALLVAGGVAGAAIPDSDDGAINACYQKEVGHLRVIDAENGAACRPSENPLTWSQTGPRGPSDAFSRFHDADQDVTNFGTNLLELEVPEGKYAVTTTVIVRNTGMSEADVLCQTLLPSGDFDIARAGLAQAGPGPDMQTLAMNPVGSSNGPGTIVLRCSDSGGSVFASWAKITATQVEDLTNTPG